MFLSDAFTVAEMRHTALYLLAEMSQGAVSAPFAGELSANPTPTPDSADAWICLHRFVHIFLESDLARFVGFGKRHVLSE